MTYPSRRVVEGQVRRWWSGEFGAGGIVLSALALPAETLYRCGVGIRNSAFQRGLLASSRAAIPVISVGNLAVGGTGKTPVTAWLVGRLQSLGARPAVVLRGYGKDEVSLHRRWHPGVPVLVGRDRRGAAEEAGRLGASVVVLDDGFQHRRLQRDLDLVLVAAEQPYPSRLLPAGPYREGPHALARAGLVTITRRTASDARVEETLAWIRRFAPDRPLAVLRLDASGWTDLEGAPEAPPSGNLLAVASVAEPSHFSTLVNDGTGESVELMAYPDHHDFTEADARHIHGRAHGRSLVVTEKDAVKLIAFSRLLPSVRVLTLSVSATRGLREIDDALTWALRSALKEGSVPGPSDGPDAGTLTPESERNPSAVEPREQRR